MWYAAHVIMAVRLKEEAQSEFPVWENVYLIEAELSEKAWEKAEHMGQVDAEACAESGMRYDDKPARQVFVGIRKLIAISNPDGSSERPVDGAEITYSQFVVRSEEDLAKLGSGQSVDVLYEELGRPQ